MKLWKYIRAYAYGENGEKNVGNMFRMLVAIKSFLLFVRLWEFFSTWKGFNLN